MNEFEKACKFSNERWGDSLPDSLDEPNFSEKHQEQMARLISEMEEHGRPRRFTKTAKIAVAAAIVCVLSVTVFAAASNGQYLIDRFRGYFHYSVENPYDGSIEDGLKVGYIPEHFQKTAELTNDTMITYGYDTMKYVYRDILDENGDIPQGEALEPYDGMEFEPYHYFDIMKMTSGTDYSFHEDSYSMQEITVGERTYLFYVAAGEEQNRLVWNEGDYIYRIKGDISKEEMLEIARHVE